MRLKLTLELQEDNQETPAQVSTITMQVPDTLFRRSQAYTIGDLADNFVMTKIDDFFGVPCNNE
jgi:hypothetical protein